MARMMGQGQSGPICVIGADIPGITRARVWRAFCALGENDAVFGPAEDGGYWLVGIKNTARVPRRLFQGVRWSTDQALADTLASIPEARVAFVDVLLDVDTIHDLEILRTATEQG
jgi:glycosyltransferase A (GT-A) superfamily protein (DUF2064 family)